MRRNIQYHEIQQFRQNWLWYLLISSSIISLLPLIIFTASGEIELVEGLGLIGIVTGVMLINILVFYFVRFEIRMSSDGIAYRWWPFFRKYSVLPWDQIDHITLRKYAATKLGFHFSREYGRVHNVNGAMGYQVVLYNGKKYFFGTQRKLAVENVLQQTGKLKL